MLSFSLLVQLLIYSLLPIIGIFFFNWDWREILILFWLENITIGTKAIIGMARSKSESNEITSFAASAGVPVNPIFIKFGQIAYFIVHYGIFTLVHGVLLFTATSGNFLGQTASPVEISSLLNIWILASIVQIVVAFFQPAPTSSLKQQFKEPYKRILPLHLALVLGGFVVVFLQLPAGSVVVLIVVKLILDIKSYISTKKSTASKEAAAISL
jgi:hypothetical protein